MPVMGMSGQVHDRGAKEGSRESRRFAAASRPDRAKEADRVINYATPCVEPRKFPQPDQGRQANA
jgi:hypothetical protein